MDKEQLEELENTFIEFYQSALWLIKQGKTKSALVLLTKSLFALLDYIIYADYAKLPENHSQRFRILEQKRPDLYSVADGVWGRYVDAYSKPTVEESVKLLQDAMRSVINKDERINQKIKEIVE